MMYENEERVEQVVLICVDIGDYDAERSLDELQELAASAGAQVVSRVIQKKDSYDSATVLGSGRLQEVAEFVQAHEIDAVIFDNELSPAQQKNVEKALETKVIDRTTLILDIFAQRARSSEGRLQVELAQLRYRLPRLMGLGTSLSRLGGGIGTRGPGETKLESDRRHIRRRIHNLEEQLEELEQRRDLLHQRRKKDGVISVAIVGYTNVGKSTLLNTLTDAGVLAKDMLFATLDPTSRALTLPDGRKVMLVDTVGLVSRLPHHLVEAFKSTLEEAALADIILNVCDASSDEASLHLDVTEKLLVSLGCVDTPIIPVLNKCDLLSDDMDIMRISNCVKISAKHGTGIDELLKAVEDNLPLRVKCVKLLFPFDKAGLAAQLRTTSTVNSEEYTAEGVVVEALIDEATYGRLREYVIE